MRTNHNSFEFVVQCSSEENYIENHSWGHHSQQVLEYQPEPWNQWLTVGKIEAGSSYHAALSIGPHQLHCLSPGGSFFTDMMIIVTNLIFIIISSIYKLYHSLIIINGHSGALRLRKSAPNHLGKGLDPPKSTGPNKYSRVLDYLIFKSLLVLYSENFTTRPSSRVVAILTSLVRIIEISKKNGKGTLVIIFESKLYQQNKNP